MQIVFVGHSSTYFYFQDYVESLMAVSPAPARVEMFSPSCFTMQPQTFYLFLQTVPNIVWTEEQKRWIALLNTEQLTRPYFLETIRRVHDHGILILDYSLENIRISGCPHHYWVPPQPPLHVENIPKTQGACMITATSCPRRYEVFSQLEGATNIQGFGRDRDAWLWQHKVLVNVHFSDEYNVHEHMRTDRCLYQGMMVVTEPSIYTDMLPLRPYLVVEERSKIPERVSSLLKNFQETKMNLDLDSVRTTLKQQWWSVYEQWLARVVVPLPLKK
uniref:Glycosyltransferase n=1 Tax=viral metagenome TaxID=1070528 RepID=A0A6C0ICF6_9ZZZZ